MRCGVSKNLALFWLEWQYRNSPVSTFLKIKPNDRLILKAVVCCLKIRRTISGKVDAVMSCKVKLYLSWTRLPVASSVRMVFQCLKYRTRVSGSSGNILGSTDGLLEDWGLSLRSCFGGLLDGPGDGGLFILGLTSGLSFRARWRSMFSLLLKYWPQTGHVIV